MEPKVLGANCEKCTLKDRPFVPSKRPAGASVAIVGEAPGAYEVRAGEPFVGPSGKLLDTVLSHHEIDRSKTVFSNAVCCRPEANRTPTASEVSCCSGRLRAEIADVDTIITLGAVAAKAVLPTREGITKLRVGPSKQLDDGRRVIPTFHPAACMRSADKFPSLVSDIGKIHVNEHQGWIEPEYAVFRGAAESSIVLEYLRAHYDTFCIDIETGAEKDTDTGRPTADILCIGIGYAPGKVIVLTDQALTYPAVLDELRLLLENSKLIAHNAKFDLQGLWEYGHGKAYFDTMLASYSEDERSGTHGLKYLAKEILGAPDWDMHFHRQLASKGDYATGADDALHYYNACDVSATYSLYLHYKDSPHRPLHDFLVEASNELMHVEREGCRIDLSYLDELEVEYSETLYDLELELKPWVDNPRSTPQVLRKLRDDLKLNVKDTRAQTLEKMVGKASTGTQGQEFIRSLLAYRREQKAYGTYVKGTRKRLSGDRIYPSFLLHSTVTGRLSSRNPNAQNWPRGYRIRRLVIPNPGNVLIQADYSQIELRVVAVLANDRNLIEIFNSGQDVHDRFAERIFGPGWTKAHRSITKTFVYGGTYGETEASLSARLNIPLRKAQKIQREFLALIPDVVRWRDNLRQQILNEQADLVTPFGRHRRLWLITGENQEDVIKESFAFYPQSIASDICLSALIKLRPMLAGVADIRIPVHDSLLVEAPADQAVQIAETIKYEMEATAKEVFTGVIPFPADYEIGTSWGSV